MSMRNTTIHYLAVACTCLLLAACGEDGETTDSIAASGGSGSGSSSPGIHGRVQFSAPTFEVNENAGNASVTLTRTDGTQGAVSVSVASRNGTATAAADYTAVATTVTFGDGDAAAKTVLVPIINDATVEPSETLYLTLSTPTGGAGVGAARETLLTIIDDDIAPPAAPTAAISAAYKQLRIDWTAASGATSYRLMKDATGNAGFTQIGANLPATQRSADLEVVVAKEDWLNARYAVAACNAAGCTQSAALSVVGLSTPLIGYLKASNTAGFASFGTAVALSADGNTLAVGASSESSTAIGVGGNQVNDCSGAQANCAFGSGAVYVYTRSGNTWSAPVYIKASNTGAGDAFGSTLSLSADGNTLAVAATDEDSVNTNQADNSAFSAGAVYVFTRAGAVWSQTAYLKASNAAQSDRFGTTLALSPDGELLAIGAPYRTTTQYGTGAAYVFTRAGTSWSESVNLTVPTPLETGYFGSGLAIVGGPAPTLVVGSAGATGSGGIVQAGAAYVYTRAGAVWSQAAVMTSSAPVSGGGFGSAVALSTDGTTLAIGARTEDVVTPSGATVFGAGAIHVYTGSDSSWNEVTRLTAASPSSGSGFGQTLAMNADGSTLAAGAADEDGGAAGVNGAPDSTMQTAGAAYLFTMTASGWLQRSYIKASNPEASAYFGGSVALNADGNILVVGSSGEDSAATGLNGNQLDDCGAAPATNCANGSGAVYIY